MRFRLLLLLLPVLLGACSKTDSPVRLDFVGIGTLISGNKTVSPNDTLTTRAYAVGNDNALTRLRITVKYEPTRNPIIYPIPLSNYDPKNTENDDALVYLDSLVRPRYTGLNAPRGGELLFVNKFTARSTSGTELWQYTATDVKDQTASRSFRLTARKADSAAVFHNYTALLRPTLALAPDTVRDQARVFLALRSGLLLPRYAVLNNEKSLQGNQALIDLICLGTTTTVSLNAPADILTLHLSTMKWPDANRRRTRLRRTGLSPTDFGNAATTAAFTTAFAGGTLFTDSLSTGTLAKDQVVAFRISENNQTYTGLILVSDLVLGTAPKLTCTIKVQK